MQTFLPYADLRKSLECLDNRRLGKQRVEAMQIIRAIENPGSSRWETHPAVKMWKNNKEVLIRYHNLAIEIWMGRGFKNTMPYLTEKGGYIDYPWWFGDEGFHASHRSNLLRKDSTHYGQFGWEEPDNLPYIWPVK